MPRVVEETEVRIEWADIESRVTHERPAKYKRTPGKHLSSVLRYIATTAGILKGVDPKTGKWKGDTTLDEDEMPLRMALGMAWEDWAVGLYPEMVWQPGEIERDNVYGTPDGLSAITLGNLEICIDEFKCTWKSSHQRPILGEWMWMNQGMGYCAMSQMDIRYVRYHVMYVCGNYRPPAPSYMRYLVEYSQQEIDRTWALVMRNKDKEGVKREE